MQDSTPLKEAGQDIQRTETRLKSAEEDVAQEHHDDLVTEVQKMIELLQVVNDLAGTETTSMMEDLELTFRGIQAASKFDKQAGVVAALVGMEFKTLGE